VFFKKFAEMRSKFAVVVLAKAFDRANDCHMAVKKCYPNKLPHNPTNSKNSLSFKLRASQIFCSLYRDVVTFLVLDFPDSAFFDIVVQGKRPLRLIGLHPVGVDIVADDVVHVSHRKHLHFYQPKKLTQFQILRLTDFYYGFKTNPVVGIILDAPDRFLVKVMVDSKSTLGFSQANPFFLYIVDYDTVDILHRKQRKILKNKKFGL
jgi:hypothetical protein